MSHPRKVLAAHFFFISAVEEAIVKLVKLLMSLEKVNNFIVDLWHVEVVLRKRSRFQYVLFIDIFSFFCKFVFDVLLEAL
jgi:hypothetical protein